MAKPRGPKGEERSPGAGVRKGGGAGRGRTRTGKEAPGPAPDGLSWDLIEFLPDATFVIDRDKRVVAWNRACEALTGVKREAVLGRGDHAYSMPFTGERRPILIDLLDMTAPEIEATNYRYVYRTGEAIYGETFMPRLREGRGAHLWGSAAPLVDRQGRRAGAIEIIRDVTSQRLVQLALKESEVKHRLLFETASDAVLLLRRDRIIDCNPRALTMFGGDRDRIVGALVQAFSPPVQPDGRPSDKAGNEEIDQTLETGPRSFEWTYRRLDGTTFPAHVNLNRLDLGDERLVQAVVRDISAQKAAARALAESERKYRELVENANSIILHWTTDGRILFINEFGQRFFGFTEDELRDRHVIGTIVPDNGSADRNLRRMIAEIGRDPAAFEQNVNENMRRDGERVWIAWNNKVVRDEQGRTAEVLSIGQDITARKRAEDELMRIQADLERRVAERTAELVVAKERAEEADRLKSAFLAAMSHELRTPLNSVIGFTGLLLQGLAGPLTEEQARQLQMVKGSGQHLLALINEVLDLSKIEAGELEVRLESFDLPASVRKAVQAVRPLADKKGLRLDDRLAADVGRITSDRRRVEQILLNLLSNAVKFTETGGVVVDCRRDGDRVVTSVTDTGIGIEPGDIGRLFQPFRQLDSGLTRQYEGTGLGLSICKRLVERLGGTISVESEPGRGSTFRFSLPLRPEEGS
ncbi:MAG TPA: PAS domain S-box protein [Candidatus Aminicenantes bacterium]|nr:PAS domain S-box protein [Candidatus Aminicenantes bacterium]HRY65094.1 PAS domain S-box protein [Candidatus Aminicenantes bacterium]HRZ72007.1 PAS domain S-box protein [Candidatus Aminicenantes bacterium]